MSTWTDVIDTAKKVAGTALPILGTALGGPVGASVGSILATELGLTKSASPSEVQQALLSNPDAAIKLRQIESDERIALAARAAEEREKDLAVQQATIEQVNQTIRADQAGKSWLQQNAQAISKLSTVGAIVLIYFALPLLGKTPPSVPESAWVMLAAILGVTAWHQGQADVEKVKQAGAAGSGS